MNLLGIRTQFIQKSGRFDLVDGDVTTYVDNGANFFIQAGQRLLDSMLPYRKDVGRLVVDITVNQSSQYLKYVRSYDSIYLSSSGSERNYLERKTYSWLLEQYGSDYGEKATNYVSFASNPSANDAFTIGTETWTFKASSPTSFQVLLGATLMATLENLVAKINTISSLTKAEEYTSTSILVWSQNVGVTANDYGMSTTAPAVMSFGADTLGGYVAGRANQVGTGTPRYWTPLVSTPHPELTLASLTSLDSHDLFFGLEKFQKDGILFMPPADKSYVMTIYGFFFSKMESDADISYHSEMYPELLIMASLLALEAFYRNTTGVNDWLASMQLWLKGQDHDLVREEGVLAGTQMRG